MATTSFHHHPQLNHPTEAAESNYIQHEKDLWLWLHLGGWAWVKTIRGFSSSSWVWSPVHWVEHWPVLLYFVTGRICVRIWHLWNLESSKGVQSGTTSCQRPFLGKRERKVSRLAPCLNLTTLVALLAAWTKCPLQGVQWERWTHSGASHRSVVRSCLEWKVVQDVKLLDAKDRSSTPWDPNLFFFSWEDLARSSSYYSPFYWHPPGKLT